jgi:integrase
MAAYRKLPSGLWRAEVFKQGVRQSSTHSTKAQAQAWATQVEAEIVARKRGQVIRRTLRQALERYAEEVSPTKKNERWEQTRIRYFCADEFGLPFVDKPADEVTADDIGKWRDARLKGVAGSTINRDLNLLSAVFTTCVKEWGFASRNPIQSLRRPADPKPRSRLITWREVRGVLRALDWHMRKPVTLQQQAGFAFLLSLHTAMRASEVLKARYEGGVAHLDDTKNGDSRQVPLSARAQRLVNLCPVFTITGPSLDALFRKARTNAGLSGFTFHDARATALTRMARTVDVLRLAKISGHKDLSMLSNTYYRESAASIGLGLR